MILFTFSWRQRYCLCLIKHPKIVCDPHIKEIISLPTSCPFRSLWLQVLGGKPYMSVQRSFWVEALFLRDLLSLAVHQIVYLASIKAQHKLFVWLGFSLNFIIRNGVCLLTSKGSVIFSWFVIDCFYWCMASSCFRDRWHYKFLNK